MVKVSNSAVAVDEPSDKIKVEKILNEKKKDKILVTGAAGFIGHKICNELLKKN